MFDAKTRFAVVRMRAAKSSTNSIAEVEAMLDTERAARGIASSMCQSNPGTEYAVYERKTVFKGSVVVNSDEPTDGSEGR